MGDTPRPLLQVEALVTGYGKKEVLKGISLNIDQAEIVALIGHNGAGKSTLLKALFGLLPLWHGDVVYDGKRLCAPTPRELLRSGIAYIPQGNRIFSDLSVRENLEVGGMVLPNGGVRSDRIGLAVAMFPVLRERLKQRAGTLSGGEKQMLTLANALVLSPRLLLLDEPSLGLAPGLSSDALGRIQRLNREDGVTILIVEQKVREVLRICNRVCCLRLGRVTYCGPPSELISDAGKLREVFL